MKINVIIRIEQSDDPNNSVEANYKECNPDAIARDETLKLLRPLLIQFLEMFGPEHD